MTAILNLSHLSFLEGYCCSTPQSDIYPPAASGHFALTSEQWFGGADAEPPQFDLETLYNAEAAPNANAAKPSPLTAITTHTPQPSISYIAEPVRSSVSPIKEIFRPVAAPITIPSAADSLKDVRPRSPIKPVAAVPPSKVFTPTITTPVNAAAVAANGAITEQLVKITALLESQNLTLESQNRQIQELTREVDTLKERVGDSIVPVASLPTNEELEELEEESRRKDEIIRKLELELEEARS